MTATRQGGRNRSDAMRTEGEGVPAKSARAPDIGAERDPKTSKSDQAKKRARKPKASRTGKRKR
jgi:hypothetical protein